MFIDLPRKVYGQNYLSEATPTWAIVFYLSPDLTGSRVAMQIPYTLSYSKQSFSWQNYNVVSGSYPCRNYDYTDSIVIVPSLLLAFSR